MLENPKEEETIYQMMEYMDLGILESHLNKHVFLLVFMLCRTILILGVLFRV